MPLHCTNCDRSAAMPGAAYCMFCGGRLSDPHATVDHVEELSEVSQAGQETVPDAAPPVRIGGYRIVRRLGEGGMGSVYEAESDDTGKRVAVKLLAPKLAANPISVERFKQEGRLASQISHPRCVFVFHADADAGRPFIVMELMPGQTLKDVVEKKGRLTPDAAVARILDVVDGLIEAHRLGLIHRDVKPSNCFLTADDRVKVGDFGLSKSLVETGEDGQLTGTGAFLGTVLYAPPEQIRGEEVGYDSDVYSVCATLYYLLTGRAPYQHESMTAALAKAISEPPPAVRKLRPDVPKALDRVVLKGLERDRKRRFNSLEELRDALQQLMPEEQLPARTRMLVAAYLIDALLTVFLVQIPVELFEWAIGIRRTWIGGYETPFDPLWVIGYVIYFAACEGFTGATLGKWLLGLRVVPHGSVGPPGFGVATLRSAIFHCGWLLILVGPECMAAIPIVGLPLGILILLGGIGFLSYRVKKATSNRGLHDLATGCHVVQLPRRPHRVRLASQSPNRLDSILAVPGLPANLGGYTLRGRLTVCGDGSQVWLADDRSLGRRVLIHVQPAARVAPPNRPARLRLLGSGELAWQNRTWHWNAFAAPAGAPLADMIPPGQPLNWPDSRLLLEQIIEELQAAEADGTRPAQLSVNQIWSEHGGRVFLLDFPVPSAAVAEPVNDSLALVRQAATLMLEGAPRTVGGAVKAPLPPRATQITNRLFRAGAVANLHALQRELAESHAHAPTVTTKLRATHLSFAAMLLALPLFLMVFASLMICTASSLLSLELLNGTKAIIAALDEPELLANLQMDEALRTKLDDAALPESRRKLIALRDYQEALFEQEIQHLSKPERLIVQSPALDPDIEEQSRLVAPKAVAAALNRNENPDVDGYSITLRHGVFIFAAGMCGAFIAAFALFALCFRGGVAYFVAGIALVQRDGRRAGRFRCALRELVLWMPILLALAAAAGVQVVKPEWFLGRILLGGAAIGLLIAYVAAGLRYPERGLLDRLFGTYRVPL